jgi:hypothetical protein
MTPV